MSGYCSPLSTRYATKEMQLLFSDQNKFSIWRKLWIVLATAEKELGLSISDKQITEMQNHWDQVDFTKAAAGER